MAADGFIVGGAANCSYLLFCAGMTKVDPIRFHLPFERFLNPLMGERVEIPLVARAHRRISSEEVDFTAILIEKGYFGEEILTPCERSGVAEAILQETNGHLVFQEQAMRLLHEIGGFSYADADMVRRELAKGNFQGDGKCIEEPFFDRAKARGNTRKEVQKILSEIAERSGKLLPKCALLGKFLN